LDILRVLFLRNSRIRARYLECLLQLPEEERLRDRGASHLSLQEVHLHLLETFRSWFPGVPQPPPASAGATGRRAWEPGVLRRFTEETDRAVLSYVGGLREGDLEGNLARRLERPEGAVDERFPVADVPWHLVEEELQHRGEFNTLLWQMNVEPPLGRVEDWHQAEREAKRPGPPHRP
jgi:uncharacterized damage-inducible protein DinB